jgi:hypothetical protein
MSGSRVAFGAAIAFLILTASAASAAPDSRAQAVLAAAKAASGGAAWDQMPGWHEVGIHNGARYETWLDPYRYGMTTQEARDGKTSDHRFNGHTIWFRNMAGVVTAVDTPAAVADAKDSAYFSVSAYFFPNRFPADISYAGERQQGGVTYDVLHIVPAGVGADLWFDRATHLPGLAVIHQGSTTLTVTLSDYRDADGIKVPWHVHVSDGDPKDDDDGHITSLDFPPVDRAVFAAPAGVK